MIDRYERIAMRKCPVYDPEDASWKKYDELLGQQEEILTAVRDVTTSITTTSKMNLL